VTHSASPGVPMDAPEHSPRFFHPGIPQPIRVFRKGGNPDQSVQTLSFSSRLHESLVQKRRLGRRPFLLQQKENVFQTDSLDSRPQRRHGLKRSRRTDIVRVMANAMTQPVVKVQQDTGERRSSTHRKWLKAFSHLRNFVDTREQ